MATLTHVNYIADASADTRRLEGTVYVVIKGAIS